MQRLLEIARSPSGFADLSRKLSISTIVGFCVFVVTLVAFRL